MRNKFILVLFSIFMIILLSGCSQEAKIDPQMFREAKEIYDITDSIFTDNRMPTEEEQNKIVDFSNKYSKDGILENLSEDERKILEYINLMGQCAFMFAVAGEQEDYKTQAEIFDEYFKARGELMSYFG